VTDSRVLLPPPLRGMRAAFVALTRLPAGGFPYRSSDYAWATAHAPLVGAVVGLATFVAFRLLAPVGEGAAAVLAVGASMLVTGAFHEDGLADCADAFGGGYTRDDVLRIMHDSRIGAFGAIALVIALALKWQTLAALPPMRAAMLMIAAHAASRAFAISYLVTLDYVRAEGKAKPVAQRMSVKSLALALAFGLPWLLWMGWRFACVTLVVLASLRFIAGRYFVRRIGGYTGDCLGCAQQVFELAIYLTGLAWISY